MGPSCVQQALAQAETFKVFKWSSDDQRGDKSFEKRPLIGNLTLSDLHLRQSSLLPTSYNHHVPQSDSLVQKVKLLCDEIT